MKKNFKTYSIAWNFPKKILLVWLLCFAGPVLQAQTPVFDNLKAQFEEGSIFTASFTHEYRDSYTGEHTRSGGEIWIGKDKYRVESEEQVMLVENDISRVYDGIRNRLLISDYIEEEDDFAPSRMLQGVDDTYRIMEENSDEGTLVRMTSGDPFAIFSLVEISISPDGVPEAIQATDQADNILMIEFESGRFIDDAPGLFEMDIPENAERVDLRH